MAKSLNKSRIKYTRLGLIALFLTSVFASPSFAEGEWMHRALDTLGGVLVMACALGRLYSTAFLGGHKNASLITYGPFSMVRNPLYVFSFIGVCGVALISNHLTVMVLAPTVFACMYVALIKREEEFLLEHFGAPYREYCARVPRVLPQWKLYEAPETVPMCPRFMLFALRDSILWLSILPLFELIEDLQEMGAIPVLLHLP